MQNKYQLLSEETEAVLEKYLKEHAVRQVQGVRKSSLSELPSSHRNRRRTSHVLFREPEPNSNQLHPLQLVELESKVFSKATWAINEFESIECYLQKMLEAMTQISGAEKGSFILNENWKFVEMLKYDVREGTNYFLKQPDFSSLNFESDSSMIFDFFLFKTSLLIDEFFPNRWNNEL